MQGILHNLKREYNHNFYHMAVKSAIFGFDEFMARHKQIKIEIKKDLKTLKLNKVNLVTKKFIRANKKIIVKSILHRKVKINNGHLYWLWKRISWVRRSNTNKCSFKDIVLGIEINFQALWKQRYWVKSNLSKKSIKNYGSGFIM